MQRQGTLDHKPLPVLYGVLSFVGANTIFGFSPLYWNLFSGASPLELVCHRVVWAAVILFFVNWLAIGLGQFRRAMRNRTVVVFIALCAVVHLGNWLVYIWAVTNGRVLDASLGQYFAPMISTVLGLVLFRERPRRMQAAGICLAAFGVAVQTVYYGRLPWIAVALAFCVSLFPVLRKYADVGALPGMFMEMLFCVPLLGGYLVYLWHSGGGGFLRHSIGTDLLFLGAGVMTAVPQLMLHAGVRSVPMIPISLMQYVLPTWGFLLGVFFYRETFGTVEVVVFGCIWAGIALYVSDILRKASTAAGP